MADIEPPAESSGYPEAGGEPLPAEGLATEPQAKADGFLLVDHPAGAEAGGAVDEPLALVGEPAPIHLSEEAPAEPESTGTITLGGATGPEGSNSEGAANTEGPEAVPALEALPEVPAKEAPAAADFTFDTPADVEAAVPEEPPSSAVAATLAEEAAGGVPAAEPKAEAAPGGRVPVRQYLDATVVPVLREGLRKLCKERPEDPLNFLGNFIKAYTPPPPAAEPSATGA